MKGIINRGIFMDEQEYIKNRLEDQIKWYDRKSQWNQKRYKILRITEMVTSALIPVFMPFADSSSWFKILLALGGSAVAVIIGIQGLYNFHENWIEYRMIAETLKHEKFLYETKAGVYETAERPFKLLVDRIESIISHENINWSQLNKSSAKKTT